MIDREFIKWFYEEAYPLEGNNRSQVFANNMASNPNHDSRDYWMRQAFTTGYMKAVNDAAPRPSVGYIDWNEIEIDFDNYGAEENT